MQIDKSTKLFLFYALILFSILLLSSCSTYNEDSPSSANNPINSTYYIKTDESSFPMNVVLKEGESIYLELCDINIELYAVYEDYPSTGNNQAIIKVSYNYLSNVSEVEYNSSNGVGSYYAVNGTNFVFYFNSITDNNNQNELDMTINRYYTL